MKTIVISGGTDGMGKAVAHTYLKRGDTVVVVGRSAEKGEAIADADERAFFIHADLSLVSENQRVIEEIKDRFPVVDALVLCARHFRTRRLVTAEGLESAFALEYLSRFLLSHGLAEVLERAERPVIVNVSGPGNPVGRIHWDDLQLERAYDLETAMFQAGKANDLLGVAFADGHGGRISYVLLNPGMVASSFSGTYDDAATTAHVEWAKRNGKAVEEGIVPIVGFIDDPPAEPLSAFVQHQRMSLRHESFDRNAAKRLDAVTRNLLVGL